MTSQALTSFEISWVRVAVASAIVLLALSLWGLALLRAVPGLRLGRSPVVTGCLALVHGTSLFAVAAFCGALAGVSLRTTFYVGTATAAAAGLALARRRAAADAIDDARASWTKDPWYLGMAVLLVIGGSMIWSVGNFAGLRPTANGAVLVPWVDVFFHARLMGVFAHFRGDASLLHASMAGEPLAPYHYGSYMVPALVTDLGDLAALVTATTVYPALGMLLTGCAMVVLAHLSAGSGAALLAVMALFFMPDPSSWVEDSVRQSSYFFFQQVGVGGAYAVAVMGLALAYSIQGIRHRSWGLCIGSMGLLALAAFFKIQVVLAYGTLVALFVAWHAPWAASWQRLACTAGIGALFLIAASQMGQISHAPTLEASIAGWLNYAEPILPWAAADDTFDKLPAALRVLAPVHVLALTLGALLPLSLWLAWRNRHDVGMRLTLRLLFVFLIGHVCIRLLVADNRGYGDFAEINRKTFVWPYFVTAYCVGCLAWCVYGQRATATSATRWFSAGLVGALMAWSTAIASDLQRWRGLEQFTRTPVPAGLLASASFLRRESAASDVVQLCENDELNQLGALSERPVYIAKVVVNAPARSAAERRRFAVLGQILRQPTVDHARALSRQAGIKWLLMSPACMTSWEAQVAPAYAEGAWRLFKMDS